MSGDTSKDYKDLLLRILERSSFYKSQRQKDAARPAPVAATAVHVDQALAPQQQMPNGVPGAPGHPDATRGPNGTQGHTKRPQQGRPSTTGGPTGPPRGGKSAQATSGGAPNGGHTQPQGQRQRPNQDLPDIQPVAAHHPRPQAQQPAQRPS